MTERIRKTMIYLRKSLAESPRLQRIPGQMDYRYTHSLRVAAIGAQIARADGLDEEALVLGCLLHDISYRREFLTEEEWQGHGRESAVLARTWLQSLGLLEQQIEELCYGIAIHVDGEADFPGENTVLASLIGDCDKIDRYDVYRIYETLESVHFGSMKATEQLAWLQEQLPRMREYTDLTMTTPEATRLWQERARMHLQFHERLLEQLTLPGRIFYEKTE